MTKPRFVINNPNPKTVKKIKKWCIDNETNQAEWLEKAYIAWEKDNK